MTKSLNDHMFLSMVDNCIDSIATEGWDSRNREAASGYESPPSDEHFK